MEYYLLSELIHQRASVFGKKEVIKSRNKETGIWDGISWMDFSSKISRLSEVMLEWGIAVEDKIGVYSQNMEECLTIDFAAFAIRGITVPMYATASATQIRYIIDETGLSLLFVGEQFQYDNACTVMQTCKSLKQLVILDKNVKIKDGDTQSIYFEEFISRKTSSAKAVLQRRQSVTEDDTVHILYTSGTMGESKGVILKHANYMEVLKIHDIRLNYLPKEGLSVCFLPLTHILEKAWSFYCLHRGYTLAINQDPREIQQTILEVRPQAMCSVPRFWEKVYAGVQEKIATSNPLIRKLFIHAIKTGEKFVFEYRNRKKKAPWTLRLMFNFYEKTVYRRLKKVIGIENGTIYPCAGAPLSDTINRFIQSVNIPLVYGYGLTETTATVTCFPQTGFTIGTVGKVMPNVAVKIGNDNEILIKGKTIMHGYYRKPEITAEAFTPDGWFRTGDAGYLTENNEIVLTDRIKDLYKTSNGKYIAPQQIEMKLSEDKYIETLVVIGDRRKYVTALIVPSFPDLESYAKAQHIDYRDIQELCNHPAIHALIASRIAPLQQELASFEQIKKFTIIPTAFSITSGELTDTLKLRRAVVQEKYKAAIESMYEENK
ncbi:MAG: long-chain fatty acid--CoA ligase [Dysgonamonadaceae bacterium]|jgi:long-chain acyl-CoA synthetase|nr:long-chain fatty acid--CoA ligase [Dysgonamonadaceae bacterium]